MGYGIINMKNKITAVKYPKVGRLYQHYKGGEYKVLFLSKHTTTNEVLVNCQSIQFGSYHSRPLAEWFTIIEECEPEPICRFNLIKD
jgi:hypothetical protein